MISLQGLFATLIIFLFAYAVWRHIGIGQLALLAAKAHTRKEGVNLLDQSVHLQKIQLTKSHATLFGIKRIYEFEFFTRGDRRYLGWVVFTGRRLQKIELQAHIADMDLDADKLH